MSITTWIPERIDGPPPLAPLYGLLQAADTPAAGVRIIPDTDARGIERWLNGAQVYAYPTDTGMVFDPCAQGSDFVEKGFGNSDESPMFAAMTAVVSQTCTTYKVWDHDEWKLRVATALGAIQGSIVAREFMSGVRFPGNPYLADGNGEFPNGDTATSAIDGLALLEKHIGLTGRQGLIHCSPQIATTLRERFALDNKTGVIRTINGTVIIPDFGYAAGATPVGHADPSGSEEWMFATGPIDIRQTELFVTPDLPSQAVERGTPNSASNGKANSVTYRAERYFLVDWDGTFQASVLVDRCSSDCAGSGS